MDSVTQIVLGAACGEAVLGRKIGNKALLFGALAGTIPDLDIFIGPWIYDNEIKILAFHRGITHSIFFSILGGFLFGWITYSLYNTSIRRRSTTLKDWILFYLLALFTHPILDSFTPYGTQLFRPFSNYRVAFDNIAVADPLYTLPFLICLIVIMFFKRKSPKRRTWLKLALGLSSVYLLFTMVNKIYMDSIFKDSLKKSHIEFIRFRVQPTILNNILWYGIAETDDAYYSAFYSLFDSSKESITWNKISKNHQLVKDKDKNFETLVWFSDAYFNIVETDKKDEFRFNDLRYYSFDPDNPNSSIFSFRLFKNDSEYDVEQFRDRQPTEEELEKFINRLKGK